MTIAQIYELVIKKGIEKDPRSQKDINAEIKKSRDEYRKLKKREKQLFDKDRLKHPFADTRILYGDCDKVISNIMVGIDISGEELLAAYLLNEKGCGIDLVMSHHPAGKALANLFHVMGVHENILVKLGVEPKIAQSMMKERIDEVSRRFLPINHERSVDMARLLNVPFMCVHTPADNHVTYFLQKLFDKKRPKKVKDVLRILSGVPEYEDAIAKGSGPRLIAGKGDNHVGKIFVDMTGGTEGSKKMFARISQAGVNTIIAMHLGEEHFKAAKSEFINVVIAGHIASDTLGLNLVLDELQKIQPLNIIPCSGFVRIKR